ncbi:hypothetical protein P8452_47756 [Trifolium repens]|nr:hypothetical protein P8452_47756 [Trifolium repens]
MVATHFAKENNETHIDQTLFYIETLNAYSILCKILAKIGATDWNTKQADVLSRMIKEKVEISWKKEHSIFCLKKIVKVGWMS